MLYDYLQMLISFILTITAVVFIHEFGHYLVAKLSGIKVTDFSIGFGPKIISRKDSSGTEWKLCCIPMGGYVKFLGDAGATSTSIKHLTLDEQKHSFYHKNLLIKSLVVIAGPFANFLLGIVIFIYFFFTYGTLISNNEIKDVMPQSPAYLAQLAPGDKIIEIDGNKINNFQDLVSYVAMHPGIKIGLTIQRSDAVLVKEVTPEPTELKDKLGNNTTIGRLGVTFLPPTHKKLSFFESTVTSFKETYRICALTLKAMGQIVVGKRDTKELGGPIKIARYAGASMQEGALSMLYFISLISINLGLINLLPIPLLDGGHLLFYAVEVIFGKKISDYVQKHAIKLGFVLLLGLMLLAMVNDIVYF